MRLSELIAQLIAMQSTSDDPLVFLENPKVDYFVCDIAPIRTVRRGTGIRAVVVSNRDAA